MNETPATRGPHRLVTAAVIGMLSALIAGLALAPIRAPARATGTPIETFHVSPGELVTGGVTLEQGSAYELVASGTWSSTSTDTGVTSTSDAIYCFANTGGFTDCAETPPGPYCCHPIRFSLDGPAEVSDDFFWTLGNPAGTPPSYNGIDHTYTTTFTAPSSGPLSIRFPISGGQTGAGELTFQLFEAGGGGCAAPRVVSARAADTICGPQKVDFKFVVDGFPDDPNARNLFDDLVGVEARTHNATLRRESEDERWKAKGKIEMTTSYLGLGHGFTEKGMTLRIHGGAVYSQLPQRREVRVRAEIVKSNDRHCDEGTRVFVRFVTRVVQGTRKVSRELNIADPSRRAVVCLARRASNTLTWDREDKITGFIDKPRPVGGTPG